MSNAQPIFAAVAGALSPLFLWLSHRANRRRRLVTALPTSQVQGVFIGLVELKGTAESEVPFTSWLAERHCVLYSWSVSEHWRRTVQETYTDAQGSYARPYPIAPEGARSKRKRSTRTARNNLTQLLLREHDQNGIQQRAFHFGVLPNCS